MSWKRPVFVALALALAGCIASGPQSRPSAETVAPQPPVARKDPRFQKLHGDTLRDDYFWLRNKGTPEVEAYLRAEAAYADAMMKPTEGLQKALYDEMLARIQETDVHVPFRRGGFYYYTRTEKGRQYPILCRKAGGLAAPEQIILELNELAAGKKFLGLGGWQVSDDGNLLAYSTDETGFRQYDLHIKDLRSGAVRPESIPRVDSFAWTRDGDALFYVVEDPQSKRPHRLYRHVLDSTKDDLVYEEADESFVLEVHRSRSRDFLFVTSRSHTASEVRFFGASDPYAALIVVQPREKGHEYYVDHRGGLLYIRTNAGGRNFRLVTAPVWGPRKENWTEIVPHRDDVMLQNVDLFQDFLVRYEREGGLPQIAITDFRAGETRRLSFPEAVYFVSPEQNREFDQPDYRIQYQSPITPLSIYDVVFATLEWKLLKRTPVLGGYDPSRYRVERVFATAADGARIPIALLHKKGLVRDAKAPLYLYGYGSCGAVLPDSFSSERFSLVDRGVTIAIAHIRGGGEMGKKWHDQGRMFNKMNTFTDFIASAEFLIKELYTSPDRLAIGGGSAGGLLIGAVLNLRPELFHTAVLWVPFVDVITTMLDETLPLTVGEFEEWGNPKIEEQYRYISRYSPYDNVAAKPYPTMLVKSSYNDSQVMYWEPAKHVAKLRATKTDKNPLLFKINMDPAGHGGASGRYDRLRETAFDYAFIMTRLLASSNPL